MPKNRKGKKTVQVKHDTEEEDYDQLDLTPEDIQVAPFTPLQPTPPNKRRRISNPDDQHLEENQELSFPSGSKASPYLKHTSPVRRKMEVLITSPSKAPR